jgi:hypothetical protein
MQTGIQLVIFMVMNLMLTILEFLYVFPFLLFYFLILWLGGVGLYLGITKCTTSNCGERYFPLNRGTEEESAGFVWTWRVWQGDSNSGKRNKRGEYFFLSLSFPIPYFIKLVFKLLTPCL